MEQVKYSNERFRELRDKALEEAKLLDDSFEYADKSMAMMLYASHKAEELGLEFETGPLEKMLAEKAPDTTPLGDDPTRHVRALLDYVKNTSFQLHLFMEYIPVPPACNPIWASWEHEENVDMELVYDYIRTSISMEYSSRKDAGEIQTSRDLLKNLNRNGSFLDFDCDYEGLPGFQNPAFLRSGDLLFLAGFHGKGKRPYYSKDKREIFTNLESIGITTAEESWSEYNARQET